MSIYAELQKDVRFVEGLKACMNCGVCTAICPAAEFSDYDPRMLISVVQSKDEEKLEELLKGDLIWLCGQCMSCKTRCPRGNCPGQIISVLRAVSQKMGFFTESAKGRQQYVLKKVIGENILKYGYCIHPTSVKPELHPEQGPVWEMIYNNLDAVYERLGANLDQDGPGTLRRIPQESLDELQAIFDVSGGTELLETIEIFSCQKAREMGYTPDDAGMQQYFEDLYRGEEN
jgi:heterodisulfide reductase subunit C